MSNCGACLSERADATGLYTGGWTLLPCTGRVWVFSFGVGEGLAPGVIQVEAGNLHPGSLQPFHYLLMIKERLCQNMSHVNCDIFFVCVCLRLSTVTFLRELMFYF